jgi:hypothetical protein
MSAGNGGKNNITLITEIDERVRAEGWSLSQAKHVIAKTWKCEKEVELDEMNYGWTNFATALNQACGGHRKQN